MAWNKNKFLIQFFPVQSPTTWCAQTAYIQVVFLSITSQFECCILNAGLVIGSGGLYFMHSENIDISDKMLRQVTPRQSYFEKAFEKLGLLDFPIKKAWF